MGKENKKESTTKLFGYDGINIVEVKSKDEALTKTNLDKLLSQGIKKK